MDVKCLERGDESRRNIRVGLERRDGWMD